MANYVSATTPCRPSASTSNGTAPCSIPAASPELVAARAVVPFIEQSPLYNSINWSFGRTLE